MVGNPGSFSSCGLCVSLDEGHVYPRAAAWLGEDISGGDTPLHQAAAGLAIPAVDSRPWCVPHDGGKSPIQSSAVDIIYQKPMP